jgi:hypothetical protein
VDPYTALPWDALCDEVGKLPVTLPMLATPTVDAKDNVAKTATNTRGRISPKPWTKLLGLAGIPCVKITSFD